MASSFTTLLVLLASAAVAHGEIHAILVAGSKGWSNYRHQADIAHAYTLLAEGGVPKSNVVTMMYDDIASHWTNPFKGRLYNRPANTSADAKDVYAAVKDNIDYRGSSVNPNNFLDLLQGNKPSGGTGRTLNSTDADDVFVYFADHGGAGSLAFPGGFFGMKTLAADKIIAALKEGHSKKLWKRLVFYTEACESGSIFDGLLPANISVYAVTAANGKESSWGWYCDSSTGTNKVLGKTMGVCLGDEFSVTWMEDTDAAQRSKESLDQQYNEVKNRVTKSHVQHFGDMSIAKDVLGDYMGIVKGAAKSTAMGSMVDGAPVSSRDAELKMLEWQLEEAERGDPRFSLSEARAAVLKERAARDRADRMFGRLWWSFNDEQKHDHDEGTFLDAMPYRPPRNFWCLEKANAAAERTVGPWTDYSLQYMRVLTTLCETEGVIWNDIAEALGRLALHERTK